MIVITRNGKTTVYTGWRAWLIGVAGLVALWLIFALLLFLWIGATITIGLMLMLLVPAAAVVALLGSTMRK
jgi:hypothetical protein